MFLLIDGCSKKEKPPMDCQAVISLALQSAGLIVTSIFGLIGIMIALIKLSRKK